MYKKSGQAYLAAGATDSVGYANLLRSMAVSFGVQGKYREAMAVYKKSEQAFIAAGATKSVGYANLLKNMAIVPKRPDNPTRS